MVEMENTQAKVAVLVLSDDPSRTVPGLVLAKRMKENRGADVRVLFFGPGVKLLGSGAVDEQLVGLVDVDISPKACSVQAENFGLVEAISSKPVELLHAGAEVELFAKQGYTVLSF